MSAEIRAEIHAELRRHDEGAGAEGYPDSATTIARIRALVDRADRFGQCALRDATPRERLEAASMLLLLSDPLHLVEALRDAGLHAVTPEAFAVLEECRKVRITVRALGLDGESEPAFCESTRGIARAEHAKREALARAMKLGGGR